MNSCKLEYLKGHKSLSLKLNLTVKTKLLAVTKAIQLVISTEINWHTQNKKGNQVSQR